jgi:hypothetical protein
MVVAQIKTIFKKNEDEIYSQLSLDSLEGKDHLIYADDCTNSKNRKSIANIIDNLKPVNFVEGEFGNRKIAVTLGDAYINKIVDAIKTDFGCHKVIAQNATTHNTKTSSTERLARTQTSVDCVSFAIDLDTTSPTVPEHSQQAALKVLLDIVECLSPLVIAADESDDTKNEKKIKNYWREGFKNELANNILFANELAKYLAMAPVAGLKEKSNKTLENQRAPFEFFVQLKRSLGVKKTRTFSEQLASVKVNSEIVKCEHSALDAVINEHRTPFMRMFGGTRTLKTAVKEDKRLVNEDSNRVSVFKK